MLYSNYTSNRPRYCSFEPYSASFPPLYSAISSPTLKGVYAEEISTAEKVAIFAKGEIIAIVSAAGTIFATQTNSDIMDFDQLSADVLLTFINVQYPENV